MVAFERAVQRTTGLAVLRCPGCRSALEEEHDTLCCRTCWREWPIQDGVPQFGGRDTRPQRLTLEQRQQIMQCAVQAGWEAALHDELRALCPITYRQAVDQYRAQWRFMVPLGQESHVLDLNAGWGATAFSLAENCELVVAADVCPAQAGLIALRARQSQQNNVLALQLGVFRPLPFAEGVFDAVVLVDGLAWTFDRMAQGATLRQIRSVLRPGGVLLLAEANRLGLRRAPQSGIINRPRSIGGYRRLLKKAGFNDLQLFAPAPSHLEPFYMIPLDSQAPFGYLLREIAGGQDVETQFRKRGQESIYRLARMLIDRLPITTLARMAMPLVPSVAIVART